MSTKQPPFYRIFLLTLLLVAFALRIYHLAYQSLWYDEGVTATLAQRDLVSLTTWTARDIQPPLYYYVVAGWGRLAGWSEWSLRFVSVWWGLLHVPLMAVLARKLTHSRDVALIAALLTATHPLLIYYSQEARMYTMVVALGLLAGYLFLRVNDGPEQDRRAWLLYVAAATAAIYTHYFALFLIPAWPVARLITAQEARQRWRQFVGYHLLILLLFLAWLAPLLTQLRTDSSYWRGDFKLGEALYGIAVRFVVGETVLEANAATYLVFAGIATLLTVGWIIVALRKRRPITRHVALYALCWLLLPVLGVLTLASFVPKFNERYVLLALPGLILLWSYGIWLIGRHRRYAHLFTLLKSTSVPSDRQIDQRMVQVEGYLRGVAASVCGLLLLLGFKDATVNWFTDHSFLKAQWREAAAYVRLHHEPGEAVILVSGHSWPVWDYYAPDLPAIHLPDLQILDVDAVLDFETSGAALREALQTYNGAWLVNWQEEVVDPTGVVPIQLGWAGREKTFRSQFWEVGLRRFIELDPAAIPVAPPLAERLDANFGNQLILTGYNTTKEDELLLFWQVAPDASAPSTDWQLNLQTETTEGLLYHQPPDRRPTSYEYPVARWQPGETVMAMIPALDWAGPAAMPGHYQLQVQLYDPAGDRTGLDNLNAQGNAVGKRATLHVTLRDKTSDRPLPEPTDAIEISPGLRLAMVPSRLEAEPGEKLATTLIWYPADDFTPVELVVRWRRMNDSQIVTEAPLPMPPDLPMATWPTRDWFRQVVALSVPGDLEAAQYLLTIEPVDSSAPDAATTVRKVVAISSNRRTFETPTLALPLNVDLFAAGNRDQPQLWLLGLREALATTVEPDTQLTLQTVWQAPTNEDAPSHDYTISIQLLAESGQPVAQNDIALTDGSSSWLPGQVVITSATVTTPSAPGIYRLILVVYDATSDGFPRLVTANGEDSVELAPMIWQP